MALNERGQRLDPQAIALDRHTDDPCPARSKRLQCTQEAGLFDQDHIARGHEDFCREVNALLAAAGDAHG